MHIDLKFKYHLHKTTNFRSLPVVTHKLIPHVHIYIYVKIDIKVFFLENNLCCNLIFCLGNIRVFGSLFILHIYGFIALSQLVNFTYK